MTIGDDGIRVTVVRIERNQVRLGFEAPASLSVTRTEFYEAKRQEQEAGYPEKSEESAIGTITGRDRPNVPMHSASVAGAAAVPPRPAYEPKINDLFDNDTKTRVKSATAFGYYHAQSPAVAALNALQAALRQEEDPSLRAVFAKAIRSIAGKPFLANLLKSIKRKEIKANEQSTSVAEVPPKEETVKALFTDLSGERDSRVSELEAVNQAYRQELAKQVASALKAKIEVMPHATHDDKKALVKWVNEELRRFNLAIKSPKFGRPATLTTDAGNNPDEGRFRLVSESEDRKRQTYSTPNLSDLLANFELMEAPTRRESLAELHDRAARPRGEARRG
jgi:carbon storage regulator CsrA